jgi:branched-subunit amino acid transport protein
VENFLIFIGMAAVTFLTRYLMIAAFGHKIPDLVRRWLHYVPAAVLAALITPPVFAPEQTLVMGAPAAAFLTGAAAAWKTRNPFITILAGMATYWLIRLML